MSKRKDSAKSSSDLDASPAKVGAVGADQASDDGPSCDARLESVPTRDQHELPPCSSGQIAWQYLVPDKRMRRWTESIEIFDLSRSQRDITVDFRLPTCEMDKRWLIPIAYFDKWPVAPDLDVRDAAGNAISVPNKRENMAITLAALDALGEAGVIDMVSDPLLRGLCREVIFETNFEARVARLVISERLELLGIRNDQLRLVLEGLEDRFLLWVPVSGEPGCDQQISIRRRQDLARDEILPRLRQFEEREVSTAAGPVQATWLPRTGPKRLSLPAVGGRLQRFFGLTPFEYKHEMAEARRFMSCHLSVTAPRGLVVRDIALAVPTDKHSLSSDPEQPMIEEPESVDGRTFQGQGSDLAHFHLAREQNPPVSIAYVTLGIRGGITSLWAGAAVFTALILWAIHRLAPVGLPEADTGQLEATVAVLLIGPALASAWAIRADTGDLLESTLGGARALLIGAAFLSVVTAMSLAGFRPFRWSNETTVEVYAAVSYGVAVLIVVGWSVTTSSCWHLYGEVLDSARRNYAALILTCALAAAVCVHEELPVRLVGFTLLGAGLMMAVVFAHPGHASRAADAGPMVAAPAALFTLLTAGWFLGFYENVASRQAVSISVVGIEAALLLFAVVRWLSQ